MSCAVGWSGCVRKKRNGNHFFGVENSKTRVRSGVKNWPGIRTRFQCLLVLAHFPKAQKTVAFLGLHFGAPVTFELVFGSVHLDVERPFLQQDASG